MRQALSPYLLLLAGLGLMSCDGTFNAPTPPNGGQEGPFEADPPSAYVAKVKNLLVGLPPTDDEIQKVVADPNALRGLIDDWMQLPQYRRKMLRFFQLAFQQTQLTATSFVDISDVGLGVGISGSRGGPLLTNIEESFARTALAFIDQGRPFTELITTKQYMMTPPLMEWYTYLDYVFYDNDTKVHNDLAAATGNHTLYIGNVFEADGTTPVPLSESLDPSSPNFFRFYDPAVEDAPINDPSCNPFIFTSPGLDGMRPPTVLHNWMYDYININGFHSPTGVACYGPNHSSLNTHTSTSGFSDDDFNNWKMVTVRQPAVGEAASQFWNLAFLRSSNELVLRTPRQSYFSTPAFQANWSTNLSNQMRATANQTLIVALGEGFDGTDPTVPATTPSLDPVHATPGSTCFGCHQLLDPMRAVLAKTYTWGYGNQTDPNWTNMPAQFAFEGVIKPMSTIDDLANALATHPQFARAWASKLCYYANSVACLTDDPEFQRIVDAFVGSNYQWNTLVREMFASPLTTNAKRTASRVASGVIVSINRLDHFCAALEARLGVPDPCVLDRLHRSQLVRPPPVQLVASGLPSDGYGQGDPVPVLPYQPTLFYRAAVENICVAMAPLVIDAGATSKWSSANPDAAIADFVSLMMGFTASNPRTPNMTALLKSHFNDAVASGETASSALQSAFVVSCTSSWFTGIGM